MSHAARNSGTTPKENKMFSKNTDPLLWIAAVVLASVVTIVPLDSGAAEFLQLPDGAKVDLSEKCPVCGMPVGGKDGQGVTVTFKEGRVVGFHGVAAAVFKDGRVVGFEGARCLFLYNSVPQKYGANVADIAHQYVTDFVTKKMIELPKAFLVLGSEVKGPMGYELVAFSNIEDAAKFASENDGKWIVRLHEVARAAQKEPDKTGSAEVGGLPKLEEKPTPVPAREPTAVQSEKRAVERPQKRSVPQPRKEIDWYDPFVGTGGHHGGGHHGH